jgi:hypothetical protein
MAIPFRISQIKTQQFAMFPDLLVNGEKVLVTSEFNFGVNKALSSVRCISKYNYTQNEKLLLTTEIACFFDISAEGSKELAEQGKLTVEFLRYIATIATGTARGIIHAKTEGTVINSVVLPPVNLVEAIKTDFKLEIV